MCGLLSFSNHQRIFFLLLLFTSSPPTSVLPRLQCYLLVPSIPLSYPSCVSFKTPTSSLFLRLHHFPRFYHSSLEMAELSTGIGTNSSLPITALTHTVVLIGPSVLPFLPLLIYDLLPCLPALCFS